MSEIRLADNLKRFWADTDVQALFDSIQRDIQDEWSRATTKETREEKHADLRGLHRLKDKFCAAIGAGDVAVIQDTRKLRIR